MRYVWALIFLLGVAGPVSAQSSQSFGGWIWPSNTTACSSNCTSVSVNFTLTQSSYRAGSGGTNYALPWIGISSVNFAPTTNCPTACLGQFGIRDRVDTSNNHIYDAWYELYCGGGPGSGPSACSNITVITGFPVNAGDNFTFFMKCLTNCTPGDAAQTWNIKITNNTQLALSTPNSVWDNTVGNGGYGAVTLNWPLSQQQVDLGVEPYSNGPGTPILSSPYPFSGFSVGQAGANPTAVPLGAPNKVTYAPSGTGAYLSNFQPSIPIGANLNDGFICSVTQASYSMACFQGAYTAPNNPGLGP